ncbi:hypothetical protein STANM309S_05413 [Streptomyces tanashiensis]
MAECLQHRGRDGVRRPLRVREGIRAPPRSSAAASPIRIDCRAARNAEALVATPSASACGSGNAVTHPGDQEGMATVCADVEHDHRTCLRRAEQLVGAGRQADEPKPSSALIVACVAANSAASSWRSRLPPGCCATVGVPHPTARRRAGLPGLVE